MLRATRFLVVSCAFAVLASPACLGDDPVSSSSKLDASPLDSSPASTSDGGLADVDNGCPTSFSDCDGDPTNGCEADTRSSAAHCGICARACGGSAACQDGECVAEKLIDGLAQPFGLAVAGPRLLWHEPALVRGCRAADCSVSKAPLADLSGPAASFPTGLSSPRQIAVDGSSFYISQCAPNDANGCGVASCDVAGCKLQGTTFITASNTNRRAQVLVGVPGAVFTHHGIDGAHRTDLIAKSGAYVGSTYKIGDQLQAMYADAQHFLWLDDNASAANPTGGLFLCPVGGCTSAPLRLLPPPVKHLAVANGIAMVSTGGTGAGAASITACSMAGCGQAGVVLATNQAYVSDIVADASAVYWTTVGAAKVDTNMAAVGTLMRCALPDCAGGPQKIADALLNPNSVQIDGNYVYWLLRGSPTQPTGAIYRRRR